MEQEDIGLFCDLGRRGSELAAEEPDDGREFACDDDNRAEGESAEQVGVPRQGECGALDDEQGSFDDDGVDGGDGEADDDVFERKWCAVEEDAREEASGDNGAGREDGRAWRKARTVKGRGRLGKRRHRGV